MSDSVSLDELITDEWYPGFKPEYGHAAFACEPIDTFHEKDKERFWFLDFHWPRGLTPMGLIFLEDGYCWGTQCAAQGLPLPPGKGLTQRIGGTHVYASEVPNTSQWELGYRGARIEQNLPKFLQNFDEIWNNRVWELELGLKHFENYEFSGKKLEDIAQYLIDARTFQKRAWEIHFEMMYPLLANYLGFYGICSEFNIDPGEISKFLQGYDTKILECDRELWKLTASAREDGIEDLFAQNEPEVLKRALSQDPRAGRWLSRFETFLQNFGWRTEGISDIALAPWIEDPTSPLGTLKTFLQKGEIHDFEKAKRAAEEEREVAIDQARSKLTKEEQAQFDGALESCKAANFAWWNDEHNYYIDLRATIPMRRGCLALADAVGADTYDDTLFLFWPEMKEIVEGDKKFSDFKSIVHDRRQYYEHWLAKRPSMPKVVGNIPEAVSDPIMIEIFGMHHHFFNAMKAKGKDVQTLTGVAASAGTVRGVARVLHNASELHRIQPGEILVCEATSPNWTPAFAKISACVCDGGGTLTHASIISREYRIPCVVGCGLATDMIESGDEVEVDGTKGTVTVFKKKAAA
jgi:phosphohistidine swiveling domain-containing protein